MKSKTFKIVSTIAGVLLITFALLYLAGFLTPGRIDPGRTTTKKPVFQSKEIFTVIEKEITRYHEAIGTIESKSRINISSQTNGQIKEVLVKSGQSVKRGQRLIIIDKKAAQTKLRQAKQSLQAARAGKRQALHNLKGAKALLVKSKTDYDRMKGLHSQEAITDQRMEAVQADYDNTVQRVEQSKQRLQESEANVKAAEQAVQSVEIELAYTEVKATEDGIISKRLVEPGDLAGVGTPLLIFYNPQGLRLEASIRENLIGKVKTGEELTVGIDALSKEVTGSVSEIAPSADPTSRTFLIKVTLPMSEDLYPGMFGRLFLPLGTKKVTLAPQNSVYRVGQLEMVRVKEKDIWHKRYVRTGKIYGAMIEILSGLNPGDLVAIQD